MSFRAKSARFGIRREESPADLISDRSAELRPTGSRTTSVWKAALQKFPSLVALERVVLALSRRKLDSNGLRVQHLDQAQMLAYLDGELGSGTAEASSHLQSCWSCRSEMRIIRMKIRTFLADRDAHLPESESSASAERIGELRRRLTKNEP